MRKIKEIIRLNSTRKNKIFLFRPVVICPIVERSFREIGLCITLYPKKRHRTT